MSAEVIISVDRVLQVVVPAGYGADVRSFPTPQNLPPVSPLMPGEPLLVHIPNVLPNLLEPGSPRKGPSVVPFGDKQLPFRPMCKSGLVT